MSLDDDDLKIGGKPLDLERRHPRLIVCEGISDKNVLDALIKHHSIPGMQVVHSFGRTNFNKFLRAARVKKFSRILLISDCDQIPKDSYRIVCEQIAKASYKVPESPRLPVNPEKSNPGVEILMLPREDIQGCLETICLPAFQSLYGREAECVEAFAACVDITGWDIPKSDEMKLHCLLSAAHKTQPRIALQHYALRTDCPLNWDHECFKDLVEYLMIFSKREA
jgi:hypothetical protein